jgi:cytochrome P450
MLSLAELRQLREAPHEFLRAQPHGDRVRALGVGPLRVGFLRHPDDVQHVLVTHQANYSKNTFQYRFLAGITGEGLLTMDGPPWLARRRMVQPAFHRAEVGTFIPSMHDAAAEMLDRWEGHAASGETIDVHAEMLQVALRIVVRSLFGAEVERSSTLTRSVMTMLHYIMGRARNLGLVPSWLPTPQRAAFRQAMAELDEAIRTTVARRRAAGQLIDPRTGTTDLLARLLAADPGEQLTDRELRNEMVTMIVAGHETVASALSWTWHLVGGDQAVDDRLAEEAGRVLGGVTPTVDSLAALPYVRDVFQETLRLYPPAWIITRKARGADNIGGVAIRKHGLVVLSPYATQRDPRWWDDPDRFDPDRFTPTGSAGRPKFAYFPFGGGPHLCIGNHFALVEAAVIMSAVVQRYRLKPVPGHQVIVDPGVTLAPKGGLPMRVQPRN